MHKRYFYNFGFRPAIIFFIFCAVIFFTDISDARASVAPSLAIFPDKFEWSLSRREVRKSQIHIVNTSDVAMPVHLRLVRWDAEDEIGGMNFFETQEDISFDMTGWIKFAENDMVLKSGESRDVAFTVTVPSNAEPGGKYGAVFVEPVVPEIYFEGGETRILPRLAILFLLDIPVAGLEAQTVQPLSIAEFSVEGRSSVLSGIASRIASLFLAPLTVFAATPAVSVDMLSRAPSGFVFRVRNEGITHIRPHGTVTIYNTLGAEVTKAELAATTILPHKVRLFPISFTQDFLPLLPAAIEQQFALGQYRATVVLDGVGNEPFVKSFFYWVFPWQSLLTIGVIFIALWLTRKRFIAAIKILFNSRQSTGSV